MAEAAANPVTRVERNREVFSAVCDVIAVVRKLGLRLVPTDTHPFKMSFDATPEEMPLRLYRVAEAIEALDTQFTNEEVAGAFAAALAASATQAQAGKAEKGSGKIEGDAGLAALRSLLMWLMREGFSPTDLRNVTDEATMKVMGPGRTIVRINSKGDATQRAMGVAAPTDLAGIRTEAAPYNPKKAKNYLTQS